MKIFLILAAISVFGYGMFGIYAITDSMIKMKPEVRNSMKTMYWMTVVAIALVTLIGSGMLLLAVQVVG